MSLRKNGVSFSYASGYNLDNQEDEMLISEALVVCEQKDKIVLSIGLTESYESEGFDRTHLNLPIGQLKLIKRVTERFDNVIVILQGGAPTLMPYKDDVKAIINAYLPGEAGAKAISHILLGWLIQVENLQRLIQ